MRLARGRPFRLLAGFASLVVGFGACSASDPGVTRDSAATLTTDRDGPGPGATDPGTIRWEDCGVRLECGTLTVPLDYAEPQGATVTVALERRPADKPEKRIGSMLVNPGGPGASGLFLAEDAEYYFDQDLLDRFDIVAFDPRGVGESTPAIDCVDDLDPYFSADPTPDDDAEHAALATLSEEFADACAARSGSALLANVSTRDAATDLDRIRDALGEEKITYFGFSYGTELGATWLTMFPSTVRAAVLDSAAAPNANDAEQAVADARAMDGALARYFEWCDKQAQCARDTGGDPRAAFVALMSSLEADPLVVDPDRPPVNEGVAAYAVFSAMYDDSSWPGLADALREAADGDGTALLAAYDSYLERTSGGTFSNTFEALIAINCLDDPDPGTPATIDEITARAAAAAPLLGGIQTLPYVCADWPVRRHDQVPITGKGAGAVLVAGATGDPVTSIEDSRKMADALEGGVLLTVAGNHHIAYGTNRCVNAAIDAYLIELTVPADGTVCD